MRVAIHAGEADYSKKWILYCKNNGISFETVNCFDSDIITKLKKFQILLWHWKWIQPESQIAARQIIASIEKLDICVYPNLNTCWHYDDKIGQKYLLEAVGAPTVPTWIFFEKEKTLKWIEDASFPVVFKLRCGSASTNVSLVKNKKEAKKKCDLAFSKGFAPRGSYFNDASLKIRKINGLNDVLEKMRRMPKFLKKHIYSNRIIPRQVGYVYFQQFLPGNNYDTRITIIGNKAFGSTRYVRKNDFRASGSGVALYDHRKIDKRFIVIGFDIIKKIGAQSLAFDFMLDENNEPRIIEISYCFPSFNCAVTESEGYWDGNLDWHTGKFCPEDIIIENIINEYKSK